MAKASTLPTMHRLHDSDIKKIHNIILYVLKEEFFITIYILVDRPIPNASRNSNFAPIFHIAETYSSLVARLNRKNMVSAVVSYRLRGKTKQKL